uniref:CFA20 domain-containing protein n=1 Tax=Mola mola TaxID=94237 RepID=A0A3Q3XDZ3_MOLML
MFKNTFQSGFLSILYSIGSKPLQIWEKKVRNGHIKRITDNDIHSQVLEVEGTNVSTTYITCPADPKKTLGIKLPFLVMIIKNLKKYFTFEVQVLDDKNVRRRFRASNYQSTTRVKPFICTMPMRLDDGWNQIQFNLSDFTRRAYGTNYIETLRVQIHANCRIRRVYFSDRLYSEDELPAEFKLYLPVQNQKAKVKHTQTTVYLLVGKHLQLVLHSSFLCFFLAAVEILNLHCSQKPDVEFSSKISCV